MIHRCNVTNRLTLALALAAALVALGHAPLLGAQLDVGPFATPLPEGQGFVWDDPREIHWVVARFKGPPPPPERLRVEYWGSRWPQQHLPKDREPGGGDVGWMELGNWYNGGWRVADTTAEVEGNTVTFSFRPVNAKEFPGVTNYPARFRHTLKLRLASDRPLADLEQVQALTDSRLADGAFRFAGRKPFTELPRLEVFNGRLGSVERTGPSELRIKLQFAVNSDPNTFDRTLVTFHQGKDTFTAKFDDLLDGPLLLPMYGAVVLPESDARDYATVTAEALARGRKTLYDQVAELPEQSWRDAWDGMPPKKSRICFILGLDGGRQRFRLNSDGSVYFRWNDEYMEHAPGQETPRLALEKAPIHVRFDLPIEPTERHIEDESLPICETSWETNGVQIHETAFATMLTGSQLTGPVPPADAFAVALLRLTLTNPSSAPKTFTLPVTFDTGSPEPLRIDPNGLVWRGEQLRGQITADSPIAAQVGKVYPFSWSLTPGATRELVVKVPFAVLTRPDEQAALQKLDFEREHAAVSGYWRRRLEPSARLITPEPVLNNFYRAVPSHLLINCEREVNGTRRFARVGSLNYGAYGNESCMMVVDLDRRGYHREAEECLDAWLHYQGTVGLPGDFASTNGVLYGAHGYESGGYNQHHGWILWMLAEHYRFTRDDAWLRTAAPGIRAGADWIIRETRRTAQRHDLSRGLLPAGDLEDIGDWWTWLSTSCYTWRGLDAAAWALEQIHDPSAREIRAEATRYHANLIANFKAASERSPVVRLRNGVAVPQIPSYVERRGRSFGWICETLEGAEHLLITRALPPRAPEAEWIVRDYEDNLFLSNQYGYTVDDFDKYWFSRGGMSMQACLLLDVEPYLYRDDVKQALRALFNALAVNHFPDVHMNTEHALPEMGDWRGDHYKSSDEANVCGWLRYLFLREEGDELLVGQAVPLDWLKTGQPCGIERSVTYFGPASVSYITHDDDVTAQLDGPRRNPPKSIRLRFRRPDNERPNSVTVNGKPWKQVNNDWVLLPGNIGQATIVAHYKSP